MGKFSSYAAKASPTISDKLLIDDVADVSTPTGMEKVITLGQVVALASGGGTALAPSGDTTGATDAAAINTALASFGSAGGTVALQVGSWYVNAPLIVPAGCRLTGTLADVNDLAVYGTTLNTPHATWAQGGAPFAAAIILNADAQADTFNLNCHFANSNAMDGITSNNTSNVLVHDINIYNGPQYGINARGNTWRGERVMVTQSVLAGFNVPASDSEWLTCNASASQSHGWIINNAINTKLTACRAEFNAADGYHITGDNTATGGLSLIGCSTDRNAGNGVYVSGTGNWPVTLDAPLLRRDGSNGTGNAVNIAASNTLPVIIGVPTVFPGFDDGGGGTQSPVTGVSIGASVTYVSVTGGMIHAVTTAVSGTITQAWMVGTRAGAWNSPSAVTMLHSITGNAVIGGTVQGSALIPAGLTGATAASRYVGATASGAPASGTFAKGDLVVDQTGAVWICTTAGSPGTWTQAGGGGTSFNAGKTYVFSLSRYLP